MSFYLKTKDFLTSDEIFTLEKDTNLDMLITKPQPKDLDKYYKSTAYISHSDATVSFVDKMYQAVKKYSIAKKVKDISKYASIEKTLLDIGAGTGDFLAVAKNRGWNVVGVEPSETARLKASEKNILLKDNIQDLKGKKFDVITLWHVLEHLPDLENQIKNLKALLAENGTLIIAVPNYKSFDALWYKEFWAAFDVPRHLWHFSRTAITKLFKKENLEVIQTKPMWFDAFYVALLSEQHKTGKQNLIKAFCIGFWSNAKALFTKEYSSVIYILKNK